MNIQIEMAENVGIRAALRCWITMLFIVIVCPVYAVSIVYSFKTECDDLQLYLAAVPIVKLVVWAFSLGIFFTSVDYTTHALIGCMIVSGTLAVVSVVWGGIVLHGTDCHGDNPWEAAIALTAFQGLSTIKLVLGIIMVYPDLKFCLRSN